MFRNSCFETEKKSLKDRSFRRNEETDLGDEECCSVSDEARIIQFMPFYKGLRKSLSSKPSMVNSNSHYTL